MAIVYCTRPNDSIFCALLLLLRLCVIFSLRRVLILLFIVTIKNKYIYLSIWRAKKKTGKLKFARAHFIADWLCSLAIHLCQW